MAPLAAVTMAGLLFVYARTSIRAAKLNAQKHREADGGQISWHKESLRRHGRLEKVESDTSTIKEWRSIVTLIAFVVASTYPVQGTSQWLEFLC